MVNEAEVAVFLEFPCFLYGPVNVGNLSLVPLPFLNPARTSEKFLIQVLLKPNLKDFENNLTSMCNCSAV